MSDSTKTDTTDKQTELTDTALEQVSGGAAYIKFDGVDGSVQRKGGNVEFEWKVERGD